MSSLAVTGKEPTKTTGGVPASGTGRLEQMNGLRGVAMLFVFLGHFGSLWELMVHPAGTAGAYLRVVNADATFGSSLFMLLSGLFSYGSLMRGKKGFAEFMRGRLRRLYPLYVAISVVYIAGSIVFPKLSRLPADPRDAAVFIVQSLLFLPGVLHLQPLMEVAWTLSFIILFYLIEGALVPLLKRSRLSRLARFILLLAAGVAWAVVGNFTGWWGPRTNIFWAGMALHEAVDGMSGRRIGLAVSLTLPAAAITVLGVWLRTELMLRAPNPDQGSVLLLRAIITSITLFAFIWTAYFGPKWWKGFLAGRQFQRLGSTSYSFYLTHGFALKAFRFGIIPWLGATAAQPLVFWTCQIAGLALSITIARFVYVLVENPLGILVPRLFSNVSAGFQPRTA